MLEAMVDAVRAVLGPLLDEASAFYRRAAEEATR
jgi:hypothetical protein